MMEKLVIFGLEVQMPLMSSKPGIFAELGEGGMMDDEGEYWDVGDGNWKPKVQ